MHPAAYFSKEFKLETERLILRKISAEDARDMYEYASRPETCKYLLWSPHSSLSYTVSYIRFVQKQYSRGEYFDFAVVLKETGKMIGTVGFVKYDTENSLVEVGYVLNSEYHGNGYATEALEAVINFAFCELGVNRVEAKYIKENTASLRVMERCSMKSEGIQREKMIIKGVKQDIGMCAILKDEYFTVKRENIYKPMEEKGLLSRLFHKN